MGGPLRKCKSPYSGAIAGTYLDALIGPARCDGCRFAARCAAQRSACDQFAGFMAGAAQRRWGAAPRAPTRALYEATVGDAQDLRAGGR